MLNFEIPMSRAFPSPWVLAVAPPCQKLLSNHLSTQWSGLIVTLWERVVYLINSCFSHSTSVVVITCTYYSNNQTLAYDSRRLLCVTCVLPEHNWAKLHPLRQSDDEMCLKDLENNNKWTLSHDSFMLLSVHPILVKAEHLDGKSSSLAQTFTWT